MTEDFFGKPQEAHAKLAASTSHIWMHCAGQPNKVRDIPRRGSAAATLGTGAHALAERHIAAKKENCDEALGTINNFEDDGQSKTQTVDSEMVNTVNVMLQLANELRGRGAKILTEMRVNLSELARPNMFGTSDLVADEKRVLHVADFKYGYTPVFLYDVHRAHVGDERRLRGRDVGIDELFEQGLPPRYREPTYEEFLRAGVNSQLLYYGAGAAHSYAWLHDEVVLYVVQPRCMEVEPVQALRVPIEFVERWARTTLKDAAIATEDPRAPLTAGEHCRWCPALLTCEAAREHTQSTAAMDFAEEPSMDLVAALPNEVEQIVKILNWAEVLEAIISTASERAVELLNAGKEVPGYKLVNKRAVRHWGETDENGLVRIYDEKEAVEKLTALGKKLKIIGTRYELLEVPKLLSPPQLEKLGKKFKPLLEAMVVKQSSGVTLARDTNRRAAVAAGPAVDFDGIKED